MKYDPSPVKTKMAVRPAEERCRDFGEVALGYTEEEARREARRCLGCPNRPCTAGCPVGVDIPAFVRQVAEGDFAAARGTISRSNALPAVCGRVCPQERQCEGKCTRGIKGEPVAIGRLERFVADRSSGETAEAAPENGKRVAVVGSGPAGLACAGELRRRGYAVTVYEALHEFGGVLVYGIPEFRLPKAVVAREVGRFQALGVKFERNVVIGRTLTLEELRADFDALFLGTGAGLPKFMHIKGENAKEVFSANEYLTRVNLMKAYEEGSATPVYRAKKAVIVGGGNVAMDAARTALRLGAETTVVYRRSEEELPVRREEVEHAREEGVIFRFLADPVEISVTEEGDVRGVKCVETELGAPDASGRRRPVVKEGSEFYLEADCVIMALGTSPNPLPGSASAGLRTKPRGEIDAGEEGETSLEGVFAGGDAVTGSATVILAMGAGKRAAAAIDAYLRGEPRN